MRPIRPKKERSKPGQAIQEKWLAPHELAKLRALIATSKKAGDLHTWRRARAVLGYIKGKSVLKLVEELDVVRASVNNWIRWFDATGTESLKPRKAPGAAPKLSEQQRTELVALIEAGPQASGYMGGVWTGPRIGDLIRKKFGVRYHNHHVPRLLHQLGFSVQRPRKRLARADREAQERWLKKRLPAIKKKQPAVEA
jgi:transposase